MAHVCIELSKVNPSKKSIPAAFCCHCSMWVKGVIDITKENRKLNTGDPRFHLSNACIAALTGYSDDFNGVDSLGCDQNNLHGVVREMSGWEVATKSGVSLCFITGGFWSKVCKGCSEYVEEADEIEVKLFDSHAKCFMCHKTLHLNLKSIIPMV